MSQDGTCEPGVGSAHGSCSRGEACASHGKDRGLAGTDRVQPGAGILLTLFLEFSGSTPTQAPATTTPPAPGRWPCHLRRGHAHPVLGAAAVAGVRTQPGEAPRHPPRHAARARRPGDRDVAEQGKRLDEIAGERAPRGRHTTGSERARHLSRRHGHEVAEDLRQTREMAAAGPAPGGERRGTAPRGEAGLGLGGSLAAAFLPGTVPLEELNELGGQLLGRHVRGGWFPASPPVTSRGRGGAPGVPGRETGSMPFRLACSRPARSRRAGPSSRSGCRGCVRAPPGTGMFHVPGLPVQAGHTALLDETLTWRSGGRARCACGTGGRRALPSRPWASPPG